MSDTLAILLQDIQIEKRNNQKKNFLESSMIDTKINLLKNTLKTEFKKGVPSDFFIKILNNEIVNSMFYDLQIYDIVILNIGKNTLYSIMKNTDYDFNSPYTVIPITYFKLYIINLVSVYYNKEGISILFELSDNDARILIKPKDISLKVRPNIKFYDFPLQNFLILDS